MIKENLIKLCYFVFCFLGCVCRGGGGGGGGSAGSWFTIWIQEYFEGFIIARWGHFQHL